MAIFGRLDDQARDRRDRVAHATDDDGAEHHDEVAVARGQARDARDRARDAREATRARGDQPQAG